MDVRDDNNDSELKLNDLLFYLCLPWIKRKNNSPYAEKGSPWWRQ